VIFPLDENKQELNDSCFRLTSDSLLKNFEYNLNNPDDPSVGIQMKLTEGDAYNASLNYQITFKIFCDKGTLASKFLLDDLLQDNNEFLALGRSKEGCPLVQISEVWGFILDNKYIFGILGIIIGFIECFFGLAILKPSLFIIGYFSGFGFLILIFGEFILTPDSSVILIWILLLLAVLFGAITGYLATSLPKIGFMALGLWFGFILAFIINNLFLYKIEVDPPGLLLYFLMAVFGLIFALLSMCIWREICIMATSFLGSYLVIRSLSLYIGHYPNELSLDKQIKYKELANVGWEFYVYFVFLIILTVFGAIVQFRNKRKIGGKFAGEFDNIDMEDIGEKYVEMDLLEKAQKKTNSVVHEENEEDEENLSKKTPKKVSSLSMKGNQEEFDSKTEKKLSNFSNKKANEENKDEFQRKVSSKSVKTGKSHDQFEEIPLKKTSFIEMKEKGKKEARKKEYVSSSSGEEESNEIEDRKIKTNEKKNNI